MCLNGHARTAPFKRHDKYGDLGVAITGYDRLKLASMALLWLPLKLAGVTFCVTACYCVWRLPVLPPLACVELSKCLCRLCLLFLGFSVTVIDASPPGGKQPAACGIVSNHVSYFDIIALMVCRPLPPVFCRAFPQVQPRCNQKRLSPGVTMQALYFPSFVARRGTEDIPLIGLVRYPLRTASLQSNPVCTAADSQALRCTARGCSACT